MNINAQKQTCFEEIQKCLITEHLVSLDSSFPLNSKIIKQISRKPSQDGNYYDRSC